MNGEELSVALSRFDIFKAACAGYVAVGNPDLLDLLAQHGLKRVELPERVVREWEEDLLDGIQVVEVRKGVVFADKPDLAARAIQLQIEQARERLGSG